MEREGGGEERNRLVSQRPDCVLALGRLQHAHEGGRAPSAEFALDVGWPPSVTYFGSVILAFS